jgi:hypothetical protein
VLPTTIDGLLKRSLAKKILDKRANARAFAGSVFNGRPLQTARAGVSDDKNSIFDDFDHCGNTRRFWRHGHVRRQMI